MAQAMGVIGIGSSLAGGIMQGMGAKQSAQAQAQMYNYQAGIAKYNAAVLKQNADFARNKGEIEATNFGIGARAKQGQIRAAQGASGLDVNSGSTVKVRESQKMVSDMDMRMIRSNAAKTAYDYETQSQEAEMQAGLYSTAASNAKKSGDLAMIGSFISTAGSVSSKWLQGNQVGLWG